jgi:hypothetical protein
MLSKFCTKCNIMKPLDQYYPWGRGRVGVRAQCKRCIDTQNKIYNKQYYEHTIKRVYITLRSNSKKGNRTFSLTFEDFEIWFINQEQKCHYCNRTLEQSKEDNKFINKFTRLSVDRKDNIKGYDLKNMVLACYRCNSIKSDFFTYEEMLEIGKIISHKLYKDMLLYV